MAGTRPAMTGISLRITGIDLFEQHIPFTHPFRFGAVTVDSACQAYVRVQAEVAGHGAATGGSAEFMAPKWFDKDPAKSPEQTIDDLRRSLRLAADAYLGAMGAAFGIHAERYDALVAACAEAGVPPLAAAFGLAELDKAVLDALFRAAGVGAWQGLAANLAGLDARLTPDLDDAGITAFLAGQQPAESVAVRHTVGFLDDPSALPATLAATGCRYVKLKLSGDPDADRGRLAAIAAVLPPGVEGASLDANEQYDPALLPRLAAMLGDPALAPIRARLLYVEQPVARGTLDLGPFAAAFPCVLDEGDDSYDAFPRALRAGWRGVSSKSCKGTYKALLNAVRAKRAGAMMTAEDLTAQPGLALQQDTALAAFLGLPHMERNGHCYTAGFVEACDATRFGIGHPELYSGPALRPHDGALPTHVLGRAIGYGSAAHPDWGRLPRLLGHEEDPHPSPLPQAGEGALPSPSPACGRGPG